MLISVKDIFELIEKRNCSFVYDPSLWERISIQSFNTFTAAVAFARANYPAEDPYEVYKRLFVPAEWTDTFQDEIDAMAQVPQEESKGFGDTVAKITHATGLDKLAELYTQITGKPCGCQSRQAALNKLFPYGVTE